MIVGDAMKKKVIEYLIILLFVPLLASIVIAITTDQNKLNNIEESTEISISDYNEESVDNEIKKSDTYIYFSIFVFVTVSGGILFFIKKERGI